MYFQSGVSNIRNLGLSAYAGTEFYGEFQEIA